MNERIFANYKFWLWKYTYFGAITSSGPGPYISKPPLFLEKLLEWIAHVLTKLYSNKRKHQEDRSCGRGSLVREELLSLQSQVQRQQRQGSLPTNQVPKQTTSTRALSPSRWVSASFILASYPQMWDLTSTRCSPEPVIAFRQFRATPYSQPYYW